MIGTRLFCEEEESISNSSHSEGERRETLKHCLLQSNCLLKPLIAGDVSSTPHSTGGTRILEYLSAGQLQPFECFPVSQRMFLEVILQFRKEEKVTRTQVG
ncbi:hypothetical protein TNCV_3170671 [Trichonephila clavipes]|nr:hypothetical protein TNCV_3170671 [Trichonephila clavipes]